MPLRVLNTSTVFSTMAEATAPAINPLMDQQTAEYVTKWPSAINTGFVLTMAYLVFMMQTGFLLLTVGSVRARSARSVCVKNVADAVFGGVAYYLFGYAFAYGDPINEDGTVGGNGFIGSEQFALSGTSSASYYNFVFQVLQRRVPCYFLTMLSYSSPVCLCHHGCYDRVGQRGRAPQV